LIGGGRKLVGDGRLSVWRCHIPFGDGHKLVGDGRLSVGDGHKLAGDGHILIGGGRAKEPHPQPLSWRNEEETVCNWCYNPYFIGGYQYHP